MKIFIDASSLTAGLAPSGNPVITMNFPRGLADAIALQLLKPYARPENFHIGISLLDYGDNSMEVAAYGVISSPVPVPLPASGLIIPTEEEVPPYHYVIGNIADLHVGFVTRFLQAKNAQGCFSLLCGYDTGPRFRTVGVPGWRQELTEIGTCDEVRQIVNDLCEF